jgi:hypothetical protein
MARNQQTVTLEAGDIFFFYRPRVEEEHPDRINQVQRLFMVLNPEGRDRFRLAVIGGKKLPDTRQKGDRNWGFIDMVRKDPESIRDDLAADTYETKTRGERHLPAARPLGEGVYRIVRHGDHTHLTYALELPENPGDPQDAMRIAEEADYIISIKNPQKGSPADAGLSSKRKADFSRKLMERFGDRRFADADPPDFLDHEGAEFILVSAGEDVRKDLGIELSAENESEYSADILKELRLDRSKRPLRPLFRGQWA